MFTKLALITTLSVIVSASSTYAQSPAPAGQSTTDYPSRTIRLIAPFAAGGSTDVLARTIAPELGRRLGQTVIVENRPGAGGNIGLDQVSKAAPDGYTIGMASPGPMVVNVTLQDSLPYDPVKDLAPIAMIADLPIVLVANAGLEASSMKELIALEKAKPGSLSFGSAGIGTTMHLSGELLNVMAGTKLTHVPYKGTALALTDIIGGQIQLGFLDLPAVTPHLASGKIKLLAVGNKRRALSAPDLPTIAEAGVSGYETSGWFGIVAPGGTPPSIIERLNRATVEVMSMPAVRKQLLSQGIEPMATTPAEFADFIAGEIPKWAEVIRFSGAKKN